MFVCAASRRVWSICTLAGLWFGVSGCVLRDPAPGACRLPAKASAAVPRFVLSSPVHYAQRDRRWAADRIGGSGKTLYAVGCTICTLSMALAEHDVHLTPAQLNQALKKVDGYSSKGWVRWGAVLAATNRRAHAEILWHPSSGAIESALAAGNPVVVKVAPPPMLQHWVLLVGRDGYEYLMKDPLAPPSKLKPLSSLGSDILAVRVVKKGAP